jgi:hypothetical protein
MPRFELLRLLEKATDVVLPYFFSIVIWGYEYKFRAVITNSFDIHLIDAKRGVKNANNFYYKAEELIERLHKLNQSSYSQI